MLIILPSISLRTTSKNPRAKILYALDINLLQFISEKAETIVNTNENLINKISLLDEASPQDLLKFLDSINSKKK